MQSIATGSAKLLRPTVSDRAPFSAHSRLEETGGRRHPQAEGRCRSARESWHLLRQARWRQPRNCSVVAPAPPNDHWPRAWAEFSPWRPVASPRDGSATFASLICARAGDGPKNCSTQWSLAARLGKFFRFNSSLKRGISLLKARRAGFLTAFCHGNPTTEVARGDFISIVLSHNE